MVQPVPPHGSNRPRVSGDDDVHGHSFRGAAQPQEPVSAEEHGLRRATEPEDTEGHNFRGF